MRFLLVLCCIPLFGFSMCQTKSSKEAEGRAYQACLMSAVNMISNKESVLQGVSQSFAEGTPDGWENAKKEMKALVQTPFISKNSDRKIRDLIEKFQSLPVEKRSDAKVNKTLDEDILNAISNTEFWKVCYGMNYDLVKGCADKFEVDGLDFKNCINPQGYFESLPQKVSPFYKRYYEVYKPLIEELAKEKVKER